MDKMESFRFAFCIWKAHGFFWLALAFSSGTVVLAPVFSFRFSLLYWEEPKDSCFRSVAQMFVRFALRSQCVFVQQRNHFHRNCLRYLFFFFLETSNIQSTHDVTWLKRWKGNNHIIDICTDSKVQIHYDFALVNTVDLDEVILLLFFFFLWKSTCQSAGKHGHTGSFLGTTVLSIRLSVELCSNRIMTKLERHSLIQLLKSVNFFCIN